MRSAGIEVPPVVRPNLLLWLRYAAWGRLSDRYRGWVLYDATCATWALRHFARLVVLVALPCAALAIWLPANGEIRALTALTTGLCAVLLAGVYVNEAADHRLFQAGWPPSLGPKIRYERSVGTQRFANAARRDRAARRRS